MLFTTKKVLKFCLILPPHWRIHNLWKSKYFSLKKDFSYFTENSNGAFNLFQKLGVGAGNVTPKLTVHHDTIQITITISALAMLPIVSNTILKQCIVRYLAHANTVARCPHIEAVILDFGEACPTFQVGNPTTEGVLVEIPTSQF